MNRRLPVSLGRLVATPGALETFFQQELAEALARHQTGDWGDLDAEDKRANDDALVSGARLLSAYVFREQKVYVITEATNEDGIRESTCVLLPDEY